MTNERNFSIVITAPPFLLCVLKFCRALYIDDDDVGCGGGNVNAATVVWRVQKSMRAPWKSFMSSMPVHALSVAHYVCMYAIYTNLSCLPQYYAQILAFGVNEVGSAA